MSAGRLLALAGRILDQFRHDLRTVGLILIVPMVVMALIGYLISGHKEPLPVAVVNADRGAVTSAGVTAGVGAEFVRDLSAEPSVSVRTLTSAATARAQVRGGDLPAAVELPANLSERVLAGQPTSIHVVVAGTNPWIETPVYRAIGSALRAVASSAPQSAAHPPTLPRVRVRRVALSGGSDLTAIDYEAPALLAVFTFLFTFMLTSVAFLRERSTGTLERLMASPISRVEVLGGYLLGFVGFAAAQAAIILGYAVWVLGAHVAGPVWLVLLILVLLVIGVVNLGIALSFYARNELQVVQFIPLILLPQIFLGGLLWPVETLYPAFRWLSQLFPLTQATVALRAVMIGGAGLGEILGRFLALAGFAAAMMVLGVLALRRQRT